MWQVIVLFLSLTLAATPQLHATQHHHNDTLIAEMVALSYDLPAGRRFDRWSLIPLKDDSTTYGALFCPPAKGTSHLPVIALRGTDNVDDWVTNVLMIKVKCELCALKHGWVHAGFYARAQELLLLIEYVLAQWPCLQPAKGLVLAGHSLGGAVSTLLTAIWPHKNVPIKRLVTFGAPAVGDKVFQQALEGAVPQQVHYTLLGDFVPEVLGVMELVRAVYEGVLSPKRPTFVTSPYQISLFPTQCALAHVDRIAAAAVWELSHLRGFIPHEMLCYIGALEEMESVQRYLDGLEDL